MADEKVIAIIPARGGSKRIPGKNIINFCGKPMIHWTIDAAKKSRMFDRIVVSTDCEKIAKEAVDAGISVPFMRQDSADDISPVSLATISAVTQAEDYYQESYDVVVQLMPNCPLRNEEVVVEAYRHFKENNVEFQISCFKFLWMNPWWAVELLDAGVPAPIFTKKNEQRSQDLQDLYCPTGAVWVAKKKSLFTAGSFYGNGHRFFPIDWKSAMDIDNYDELEMAEILASYKSKKES